MSTVSAAAATGILHSSQPVNCSCRDSAFTTLTTLGISPLILTLLLLCFAVSLTHCYIQVVASFDKSASLWVFDWPTATLSALLTGHAGLVTDASTSAGLPHLVAAGSCGWNTPPAYLPACLQAGLPGCPRLVAIESRRFPMPVLQPPPLPGPQTTAPYVCGTCAPTPARMCWPARAAPA